MLEGPLAEIYLSLWRMSDDAEPRVWPLYDTACGFQNGADGMFFDMLDDEEFWGIRIRRDPSPPDADEPHLLGANLRELISLAHERGHELSKRAGTYVAGSMAEEHRAWDHAASLLRERDFTVWGEFAEAKEFSLAQHRLRGTPG